MSGFRPAISKLKKVPVRPQPGLHVVDDQQDLLAPAERLQALQPVEPRGVQSALALHQLDDHRRRLVDPARGIGEQPVDIGDRVDVAAEVAVIRHDGDALQRDAGGAAEMLVAGRRERADGHAVEAVGEADDVRAPRHLAGDLKRRLYRIRAGRAGELHHVVEVARLKDDLLHRLQERLLGDGVEVEAVRHPVRLDVADERLLQDRIVVPVIQRAGAGEEIQVAAAVYVPQLGVQRPLPDVRKRPRIGLHVRFQPAEHRVLGFQTRFLSKRHLANPSLRRTDRFRRRGSLLSTASDTVDDFAP